MGYDQSKDVLLNEKIVESKHGRYRVAVFTYNKGEKKIAIQQEQSGFNNGEKFWTNKMSRVDIDTAKMLNDALKSILEEC